MPSLATDDGLQRIYSLGFLDLGNQWLATAELPDHASCPAQIVDRAHETERDKIDTVLDSEGQVRLILFGESRYTKRGARQVDAFALPQQPAEHDPARHVSGS